ncbi:HEAT repeat domain-containing protein [Candidatus Uabimicrobium sp. HlEnr_7]|uniref:HEAT repeat domain-containing protein n=1 Tax=Candidatus Uabimicrobium helgolandensis TaxID=3095367 RepID=UPI00355757F4
MIIIKEVIETLGKIGPKAHSALPELIHILQNSNNWTNQIQETIQKIGLKANPYLLKMLQHKKTEVRQRAIVTLGKFGLENSHLIPILTPFLKDDSPEVREVTVTALVNMGAKMSNSNFFAAEDVNTLLQLTQNNDIDIKKKAIRTLGKMGKSDLILKALQKNLQDSSYEIRLIAACSLFQLGEKEKTRPILLTALGLDEDLQLIAIQFLEKMGAESYFAVKELRKITKNFRRSRVFFTAQTALKKIRQN